MKLDSFSLVHHFTLTALNFCAVLVSNRSVSRGPSATLCPCGLSFLLPWVTAPSTSFITPLYFLSNCLLFNLYCLQFQVVSGMSCVWLQRSTSERKDLEELLHNISIPFTTFSSSPSVLYSPCLQCSAGKKIHVQGSCTGSCSLQRTFG